MSVQRAITSRRTRARRGGHRRSSRSRQRWRQRDTCKRRRISWLREHGLHRWRDEVRSMDEIRGLRLSARKIAVAVFSDAPVPDTTRW